MLNYFKNRRILKLTVLRAAIIAGTKWDRENPYGCAKSHEERDQDKRAAVLLAKTDAELEFLTASQK